MSRHTTPPRERVRIVEFHAAAMMKRTPTGKSTVASQRFPLFLPMRKWPARQLRTPRTNGAARTGDPVAIARTWEAAEARWRLLRAPYLLY